MRIGVVTFPGSLDDVDAQRAVRVGGHDAVLDEVHAIAERLLSNPVIEDFSVAVS